jgi:hypothetical protein
MRHCCGSVQTKPACPAAAAVTSFTGSRLMDHTQVTFLQALLNDVLKSNEESGKSDYLLMEKILYSGIYYIFVYENGKK